MYAEPLFLHCKFPYTVCIYNRSRGLKSERSTLSAF